MLFIWLAIPFFSPPGVFSLALFHSNCPPVEVACGARRGESGVERRWRAFDTHPSAQLIGPARHVGIPHRAATQAQESDHKTQWEETPHLSPAPLIEPGRSALVCIRLDCTEKKASARRYARQHLLPSSHGSGAASCPAEPLCGFGPPSSHRCSLAPKVVILNGVSYSNSYSDLGYPE